MLKRKQPDQMIRLQSSKIFNYTYSIFFLLSKPVSSNTSKPAGDSAPLELPVSVAVAVVVVTAVTLMSNCAATVPASISLTIKAKLARGEPVASTGGVYTRVFSCAAVSVSVLFTGVSLLCVSVPPASDRLLSVADTRLSSSLSLKVKSLVTKL